MVNNMTKLLSSALFVALTLASTMAFSAWDKDESAEFDKKAQVALTELLAANPSVQEMIDLSAGYVVIPTVGKAGFGIGGARGKGVLYEGSKVTAVVTLTQLSFGFQWGGQAYSEYLFFQTKLALDSFKRGNFELGAQASAVAITAGVSIDAEFVNGMAIMTVAKGGLMYEAAVGGQKFKVEQN
jgi:lipid-binding SYLF domain-containing protein